MEQDVCTDDELLLLLHWGRWWTITRFVWLCYCTHCFTGSTLMASHCCCCLTPVWHYILNHYECSYDNHARAVITAHESTVAHNQNPQLKKWYSAVLCHVLKCVFHNVRLVMPYDLCTIRGNVHPHKNMSHSVQQPIKCFYLCASQIWTLVHKSSKTHPVNFTYYSPPNMSNNTGSQYLSWVIWLIRCKQTNSDFWLLSMPSSLVSTVLPFT